MQTRKLIVGKGPNYYTYPGVTSSLPGMPDCERAIAILEIVKEEFSAKFDDPMDRIYQNNRVPLYVTARQVYYYFCRKKLKNISLKEIANQVHSTYSTVIHGAKKIQDLIDIADPYCYDVIISIDKRLI